MLNLDKCTPEYARELLLNHDKEWAKIDRSLDRCKRLIEDRGDYSFLLGLGYDLGDAESFQDAFYLFRSEALFLEYVLCPFGEFLRIVPNLAFYDKDEPIHSRIISDSEFFHLLLELDSEDQEECLQLLAERTNSLELLRKSIQTKDEDLFLSTIRDHQIDTTHLGQYLNTMRELSKKPSSVSDFVNAASKFQEATKVAIPIPTNRLFYKDSSQYLTKKNCVSRFVSTWKSVESLFEFFSFEMYGIYKLSLAGRLPCKLNYALSVFYSDESFQYLLSFLKECGYLDLRSENPLPAEVGPKVETHELRPLVRPPHVFADEKYGEAKCRSFYKKMVRSKNHWFREEDIECFLYLLNVTSIRPQFLRRVIWFGAKYELKCLMEVLYPNRKSREKPDYGDMAQIFCDENGQAFNLNTDPLQSRMNHITSPNQAAREEQLMRKFARFAGVE